MLRELVDARGVWRSVVEALFVLADVPLLEVDPIGADPDAVSLSTLFCAGLYYRHTNVVSGEGGKRKARWW